VQKHKFLWQRTTHDTQYRPQYDDVYIHQPDSEIVASSGSLELTSRHVFQQIGSFGWNSTLLLEFLSETTFFWWKMKEVEMSRFFIVLVVWYEIYVAISRPGARFSKNLMTNLRKTYEGVSIRLRFSVSAPLSVVPLTNMYFSNFLENYYPDSFEIFRVFRGHRCHQHVKLLRESDEGLFRGEGGKKNFRPPISPLRGVMGAPNFYTR